MQFYTQKEVQRLRTLGNCNCCMCDKILDGYISDEYDKFICLTCLNSIKTEPEHID